MYLKLCTLMHILKHVSHLKARTMKNRIHEAVTKRPLGFFSIW